MHPFCRSIWLEARAQIDPSNPPADRDPDPIGPATAELVRDIIGPALPADALAILCGGIADAVVAELRDRPTS